MNGMPSGWELRDGVLECGGHVLRVSAIQKVCVSVVAHGSTEKVVATNVHITLAGGFIHTISAANEAMAASVTDAICAAMRAEARK